MRRQSQPEELRDQQHPHGFDFQDVLHEPLGMKIDDQEIRGEHNEHDGGRNQEESASQASSQDENHPDHPKHGEQGPHVVERVQVHKTKHDVFQWRRKGA